MSDAFVESQGSGKLDDVGAGGVAGLGHSVDEGDLGREEGVGRDLDELGGGEVHRQAGDARGEERGIALVERVAARARIRFPAGQAVNQPVRLEGVPDRRSLPQELGVPDEAGPRASNARLERRRGPHGHRGLSRDDVALAKTGEERIDGVVEEGEVGCVRIRSLRGPDSDEMDPGAPGRLGVGGEGQPAGIQAFPEQVRESGL